MVGDTVRIISEIETVVNVSTQNDSIGFPVPADSSEVLSLLMEFEEMPSFYSGKINLNENIPSIENFKNLKIVENKKISIKHIAGIIVIFGGIYLLK